MFNEPLNKVYDHFNTSDGEYLMIFSMFYLDHIWIFKLIQ